MTARWLPILEDARLAPSPHNSQPLRVRITSATTADVLYDLDRGLPAESFGIPFGHVAAGVFLESLAVVARAHGEQATAELTLSAMDFDGAERLHPIGTVTLAPHETTDRDRARHAAFMRRRTNRRPYDATPVSRSAIETASATLAAAGHDLGVADDRQTVDDLIRINQETLFRDLQDDAVHAEILTWIRTSKEQAASTGDGLSAETMLMPGRILGYAMRHRELWQAPVIGDVIRGVYLRTMRGVRQLAWISGPFETHADHVAAGRAFLAAWLDLTEHGVDLHPFGTVITNPVSHAALVDLVGVDETGGRMAWMLFRLGHAKVPPIAHRRPLSSMLVDDRTSPADPSADPPAGAAS